LGVFWFQSWSCVDHGRRAVGSDLRRGRGRRIKPQEKDRREKGRELYQSNFMGVRCRGLDSKVKRLLSGQ
jgi:hypothetical protein